MYFHYKLSFSVQFGDQSLDRAGMKISFQELKMRIDKLKRTSKKNKISLACFSRFSNYKKLP